MDKPTSKASSSCSKALPQSSRRRISRDERWYGDQALHRGDATVHLREYRIERVLSAFGWLEEDRFFLCWNHGRHLLWRRLWPWGWKAGGASPTSSDLPIIPIGLPSEMLSLFEAPANWGNQEVSWQSRAKN